MQGIIGHSLYCNRCNVIGVVISLNSQLKCQVPFAWAKPIYVQKAFLSFFYLFLIAKGMGEMKQLHAGIPKKSICFECLVAFPTGKSLELPKLFVCL